ncbi:hypothetical protein G8E10_17620 [Rhizobiaceae bacterium CRRU44]|uniref:Uncharacterized protein n=1 Tax=Ferranicluibacter rubi TaxID=2715133 RepID=A0AA43ZJG9_9HYPH|nr:hypothetical protein [Ferranicluibacter rubi]NHT77536.1 hypothetical protein [Ferranicluibacter rubi]
MKITETQALILDQIIEAFRTDAALPVRVGPKAFGTAMPDPVESRQDVFVTMREDLAETGGRRTRYENQARNREIERRALCSRSRISAMEQAFGWLTDFIDDEESRKILLAYSDCKARGWVWERYISNRNRKNPQKTAWVKRTLQRKICNCLQMLEDQIPMNTIFLSPNRDLLLSRIEEKGSGKSINSERFAWMASDGKPTLRRTA